LVLPDIAGSVNTLGARPITFGHSADRVQLPNASSFAALSRHRCNALVQSTPVLDQFGDEIDHSWRQRASICA
jgi:hypothetical protein